MLLVLCYSGLFTIGKKGGILLKIISFEELYHSEFTIRNPISKPQNWYSRGNVYDSLDKPKVSHTFLWFKNCSGSLMDSEGNVLNVEKNQLIYTAKESRYIIHFRDTAPDRTDTVVIHFQMNGEDGEEIAPTMTPVVCLKNMDVSLAAAIDSLADEFKKNVICTPEVKSVIYRIFSIICQKSRRANARKNFSCIQKGIELLETGSNLSIRELATVCGVGECYFRRLFREYSGDSPVAFRQKHRVEKAKQLLLSDDMLTVGEIARELGFADIYHFSKTFKHYVGLSPIGFVRSMTH